MKPCKQMAVVAAFLLVVGIVCCLWPRTKVDPLRLKIVRQTVEKGRPVVIFQVTGGGNGRVVIISLHQVIGEIWTDPLFSSPRPTLFNASKGRDEFGVFCPSNTFAWVESTWKLEAAVEVEESMRAKAHDIVRTLSASPSRSGFATARTLWRSFIAAEESGIESDPITNVVSVP